MKLGLARTTGNKSPSMRRPARLGARLSLSLLFVFLALFFGVVTAAIGGVPSLFLLTVILSLALTFRDYRVGVVALTVVLPWATSPLLPHGSGLSVASFIVLFTMLSFGIHVALRRKPLLPVPQIMWWCYVVPFSIGILVALPHLREAGVSIGGEEVGLYEPVKFIKGRYLDGLVVIIYAYLLANAVRESGRPERWLIVFGLAAVLPVTAVGAMISLYRVSLSELQAAREFLSPLGYHANNMAWLLLTLFGPLLYVTATLRGPARVAAALVTAAVAIALALTFSRGGLLAMVIVLVMFAVSRKQLTVLLLVATVAVTGLLAVPAVRERALTGVEVGALSPSPANSASKGDALTAGRVAFWPILAREVMRSPVWGRGVGSTAWSEAARNGSYKANHPHQLFLQIAMDLGLLGLGLMLYFYYRIARTYARLAHAAALSAPMRAFFAGALASMVGCAVMGVTTGGSYEPLSGSTFLWFGLAMAMAWWPLGQAAASAGTPRRSWVFGIRPMPGPRAPVGKIAPN